MHELPFIILARRGDDDGNQEPAQDVLHEAETWRQSHVQGPCCCGLDSESTNVHAYIDRAGRGGGVWQTRQDSATNYTCTQSNQQAGYEPNE